MKSYIRQKYHRICVVTGFMFILSVNALSEGYVDHIDKIFEQQAISNYQLTIDWTRRNLNGEILGQQIASGDIIQLSQLSPVNNTIQLRNVTLTSLNNSGRNTKKIDELEGLKIEIQGDNFTNPDFYRNFPADHIELIRWFVQDKVTFNVYGQMYLDSLTLNVPFYPDFFQSHQADFEEYVNFNTQKLNITWIGSSKMNGKDCHLLYFESMYNSIDANNDIMALNGRSCFWGNIWILPDTKQIEYATMNEDLIYKMKMKANDYEQEINMQRKIKLEVKQ